MKSIALLAAIAGMIVLTGCEGPPTPSLLSLETVAADSDLVSVEGLAGAWDDGSGTIVIRRGKDTPSVAKVTYSDDNTHLVFNARPFRAGDGLFLDLAPNDSDDFHIPGHALARIWVDGNTLRWGFVDSDWFKQQTGTLPSVQVAEGKTWLTSPGSAVLGALAKYGLNEQAYGKIVTCTRIQ